MVERSPGEATGPASDQGVVWLYNPDRSPGLMWASCGPVELFELIDDALLEGGMEQVTVSGVVAGLRCKARWWGFDLVEMSPAGDSRRGAVRCVVFAGQMAAIRAALAASGTTLEAGAVATVTGRLGTNAAWGELRVVARTVTIDREHSPEAVARDALVERLVTSGRVRWQRCLQLPSRPLRIGVVAGEATAGVADIDAVLAGSGHDWEVVRRLVPMAGSRAAAAVADAVTVLADRDVDVIVVARGGGAAGEMAWADTATVADAIVGCPVPVWMALGHATDRSVADLVAHRSCETPSAAAAALIAMVDNDDRRRQAAAATATHLAALARSTARARVAWVACVVLVVLLVAMIVSGLGR